MDVIGIRGGRPLRGSIGVSGSKNAALPAMAAVLAMDGPATLRRVPAVTDVTTMIELLRSLGATVAGASGTLLIDPRSLSDTVASRELVRRMRASVCVLGPLLARFGQARVALPGGCNIGHRPIDLHLKGLAALGAAIRFEAGCVVAEARRLRGAEIVLSGPWGSTVTGTCNVMTAAALAQGRSVIHAAACEPEVCDLGTFLNASGARIQGLGTPVIEIDGVEQLSGSVHTVVTDRIEAATFAIAASITRGDVLIRDAPVRDLGSVIAALRDLGVCIEPEPGGLRVRRTCDLKAAELMALPFPGLPTDVQPQLTALLSLVPGTSTVTDRIFPDRFLHVAELNRLGADIRVSDGTAVIRGVSGLTGTRIVASDLRAGAALVLAALAAEGVSEVHGIHHLDRGYSALESRLSELGADIRRIPGSNDSAGNGHSPHIRGPAGGTYTTDHSRTHRRAV